MSAGRRARSPTSRSERVGARRGAMPSVWRSHDRAGEAWGRPSVAPVRVLPACAAMTRPVARAIFWSATAGLAWTQAGYGLVLSALRRARGNPPVAPSGGVGAPRGTLVVAAPRGGGGIAAEGGNPPPPP